FASRVRLKASSPGVLPLDEIHKIRGEVLVDARRRSRWRDDERELTATTYATDLVARELGVLDHLPCVVFLDAQPSRSVSLSVLSNNMEVLSIADEGNDARKIIRILRGAIQRLRNHLAFDGFQERLSIGLSLEADARSLECARSSAQTAISNSSERS